MCGYHHITGSITLGVYFTDRLHKSGGKDIPLRPKLNKVMSNRTFTMIKPDAMKNGHAGAILDKIIKAGFRIVALQQTFLSKEKAGEFYAVHKARPFYGELVEFMSSGVIIAAILEKNNAVAD